MVFACYDYKEFNISNQSEWPIQPESNENSHWNAWSKMINENWKYCKNLGLERWYEWKGKLRPTAHHPFWTVICLMDKRKRYKMLKEKHDSCLKHPDLLQKEFNATTTFDMVENQLRELEDEFLILTTLDQNELKEFENF